MRASFLSILLLLFIGLPADAHNRSQSFSQWTIDNNQLQMLFTVKAREATRLQDNRRSSLETVLAEHLSATLSVTQGDTQCALSTGTGIVPLIAKPGYLRLGASFNCPGSFAEKPPIIQIRSFFPLASTHVHYARIAAVEESAQEYLFTESRQQHEVALTQGHWSDSLERDFTQYTALGLEHIFTGIDHIAFLLAMMLLLQPMRSLVLMVSGFTIGHSITLCLTVLGWINLDIMVVEALIGFTIALVAAENIAASTGSYRQITLGAAALIGIMILLSLNQATAPALPILSLLGLLIFTLSYLPGIRSQAGSIATRPALSLAFGLIHGFGFAAILQEIGLPNDQLWPALLGFNIGVELGQLMI
ncbi:MAG: HupE/UreJ family protein [Porticoccaceae bacterium]|nr:HupE/UreJ family protein [Porticoccaceae bacterium]